MKCGLPSVGEGVCPIATRTHYMGAEEPVTITMKLRVVQNHKVPTDQVITARKTTNCHLPPKLLADEIRAVWGNLWLIYSTIGNQMYTCTY